MSSSQNLFQAQLQSLRDRLNNANANYLSSLQTVTPIMARTYLTRTYTNPSTGPNLGADNCDSVYKGGSSDVDSKKTRLSPSAIYANEKLELEAKIRRGQQEIANLQKSFLATRS